MGKADFANKVRDMANQAQSQNSGGAKKLGDARRETVRKSNNSGEKDSGRKG